MADPASRPSDPPASIAVLTAHARRVVAPERERLATRLRALTVNGAVLVETCHRVEGYAPAERLRDIDVPRGAQLLEGVAAVRHAVAVAAGRDSVVVGEDQVLHQMRLAVEAARSERRLDPGLERLFALALRAGRRARSWARGPERSLATVALESIEARSGPIRGRAVLVVGAGRMGRLAARAAAAGGAAVSVANRSPQRSEVLAHGLSMATAPFDPGASVRHMAGVIVAIGGPWLVGPRTVRGLVEGSATVVDLSVPPAVPGDLAAALGPRLITSDDLARSKTEAPDERYIRALDTLIEETTASFMTWVDGRHRRLVAAALAQHSDHAREAELETLWRQLPDLDAESRAAIEAMTRHFAERLLQEPLEQLGRDADGHTERAIREVFGL